MPPNSRGEGLFEGLLLTELQEVDLTKGFVDGAPVGLVDTFEAGCTDG